MVNWPFRVSSLITGISYLLFWWLFFALLPISMISSDYPIIIQSRYWFLVNIFQIIAIIFFMLFFQNVNKSLYSNSVIDNIMAILQYIGFFVFGAVAFYETILWPIFAKLVPNSFSIYSGEVFTDSTFQGILIFGGLALLISNVYLGLRLRKVYGFWGILFSIGFGLFCVGFMINPIRYILQSIGLTLYCLCFFYFSFAKKDLREQ